MPRLNLTRKPVHPPNATLVALSGFVWRNPETGRDESIAENRRIRGDHPAAMKMPDWFADSMLPDEDLERLRLARRFGQAFKPETPNPAVRLLEAIPPHRRLVVTRNLVANGLFAYAAGTIVDRDSRNVAALMKRYPDHFAPAPTE